MPPPERGLAAGWFEHLPSAIIYFPLACCWFLLGIYYRHWGLPTAANPGLHMGGLVGEKKSDIFAHLPKSLRAHIPAYIVFETTGGDDNLATLLAQMARAGIFFPCIAKPDISQCGWGVRLIEDEVHLQNYIASFPAGIPLIIQRLSLWASEFGVFYIKKPGQKKGWIFSLTLKYPAILTGDGRTTLEKLIKKTPFTGKVTAHFLHQHQASLEKIIPDGELFRLCWIGSHSQGGLFKDGQALIDKALTERMNNLLDSLEGFYFGRIDIRSASLEALKRGRDFDIIEINGAGSEAVDIWDSRNSIWKVWGKLVRQTVLLFSIAASNRRKGVKPEKIRVIFQNWRLIKRLLQYYRHCPPCGGQ